MRKRTDRKYIIMMVQLLCVMLIFSGCSKAKETPKEQETETAPVEEINVWGEVTAHEVHQLTIDFPATVESVLVEEGDVVSKGEVLAILNMDEFNATIAKTQNQKAAGEAAISGLQQSAEGFRAQIQQQKQTLERAQKDFERSKILYTAGDISQQEYEQQEEFLNTQKTTLQVYEAKLAQTNSGEIEQQVQNNQVINKELVIYQSKQEKEYLADNQVISPLANGVVKRIWIDPGTVISGQSGTVIIELIDMDTQYIRAEVDEEFIAFLQLDTPVRVVPVGNPEIELEGYVKKLGALAEEKDGGRIVNVQINMADTEALYYGYTVDVYFPKVK